MVWKKAVIVVAIVFAGALGRTAAMGTNGTEEDGCWSAYVEEVTQVVADAQSCLRRLSLFGSLGVDVCTFIYVEQAEAAMFRFIACALGLGVAFGIVG